MKTPNSTDKIFREKLGEYASEVPAGMWDAIDNQRSGKQRTMLWWQRKGKWVALIILVLGAGYLVLGDEEAAHGARHTAHGDTVQVENAAIMDESAEVENDAIEGNENKSSSQSKNNNQNQDKNNPFLTEKAATTNIIKNSKDLKNTTPIKQTPFVKSANIINENTPTDIISNIDKTLAETSEDNSILNINNKPTPFDLTNLQTNELSENNLLSTLEIPALSELTLKGKSDPCYAFNPYDSGKKGPPRLYIDVLAGPDYAHRTLTAKDADLGGGYATIRDSTETSRLGFSSTVRLSIVLANGIALRSGIAYAQINEKLDLFDGTTTGIETYEIKDVNGNVIGVQTDTVIGTRIKTTYNRFQMVDIPVILGYEVRDRNWTVSLNGGAFFNVLFKKKGEFLSPNLAPVNFSSNATPQYEAYEKTVGMSLFGSVGVNYKVGNRLHLMAEPHFRYYMDSFTNANYPLQQNYWAVGMNLGIRVQLF